MMTLRFRFVALALVSVIAVGLTSLHPRASAHGSDGTGVARSPVPTIVAQAAQPNPNRFRVYDAWQLVYAELPDFPQENQYVNAATGNVDGDNTLLGRLIRYHVLLKGRSPAHRLDWKLTLADYLGVNEVIFAASYPGEDTLRSSPLAGDVAAIQALNRADRDRLVNTIVGVFVEAGWTGAASTANQPTTSPPVEPVSIPSQAEATPSPSIYFGTGASELLLP